MRTPDIENVNVAAFDTMPTPEEVHSRLPISAKATRVVSHGRDLLRKILGRKDHRLFVVVGPCSIHDPVAGLDYARRLKKLSDEVGDTLQIIMRVYFEKPRTTVGWKGYINDPFMDDSFRVDIGMEKARQFLLDVAELGLPTGTEALDPISPQYYGDLITWTAIGARTAESQTHREMSSGLSTPVGFKNGTSGDLAVAVNAILSASKPHSFLGINGQGRVAVVRTKGNRYGHIVLRGGDGRPTPGVLAALAGHQHVQDLPQRALGRQLLEGLVGDAVAALAIRANNLHSFDGVNAEVRLQVQLERLWRIQPEFHRSSTKPAGLAEPPGIARRALLRRRRRPGGRGRRRTPALSRWRKP